MFNAREMAKFDEFLKNCTGSRVEGLGNVLAAREDYRKLMEEAAAFFREVDDTLTESQKRKLEEYMERKNRLAGIEQVYFFENGFGDALMLVKRMFCGDL